MVYILKLVLSQENDGHVGSPLQNICHFKLIGLLA
jgi:hypothetical protein